jgi:carbon starvation protein CstA
MKELLYSVYISSAVISILLMVIGMWWYSKETKKAKNRPNMVVVVLWAVLAIVNTVTYKLIVLDWWKSLPLFVSLAANIYVFVVIVLHKNYILLKRDLIIIMLGIVMVAGFVLSMSIKEVHIIMQIINTLAYIPLVIGIMDGKGKEPLGPWMVILIACIANLITIVVSYSDYWSLIQPLRSLFLQIVVIVLIKIKDLRTAPF